MQNMLEQGPDFWHWFGATKFSYHCAELEIRFLIWLDKVTKHMQVCSAICLFCFDIIEHDKICQLSQDMYYMYWEYLLLHMHVT